MQKIFLHLILAGLVAGLVHCGVNEINSSREEQRRDRYFSLAHYWAPIWHQSTHPERYREDYITSYDYDGDARSNNNWENLTSMPDAALQAAIYYSVVETETHYYILYTDYHPRDWAEGPLAKMDSHENDLEGAMMVIAKSEQSQYGSFFVLYTQAHGRLFLFGNPVLRQTTVPYLGYQEEIPVTFKSLDGQGNHPELFVESQGHGVYALGCRPFFGMECLSPSDTVYAEESPDVFSSIIYAPERTSRLETIAAPEDSTGEASYALISIEDTLWADRDNISSEGQEARIFDRPWQYVAHDEQTIDLPMAFDGDTYKADSANPPWAWDDFRDLLERGDFFFYPAETVRTHLGLDSQAAASVSTDYLYHPFLIP